MINDHWGISLAEGQPKSAEESTMTSRLIMGIINNIKIKVANIHIRYEDPSTCPGHPFAFGLVLKGFNALTTDATYTPAETDQADKTWFKVRLIPSQLHAILTSHVTSDL